MALTTNLTEFYNMEGNSNANFGSINGVDTAITYSSGNGKITQGAGFNGTSSQILLGNGSGVDNIFTTGGTIAMWIKPTAFSNVYAARMAEKRGSGGWIVTFDVTSGSTSKINFDIVFNTSNGSWNSTSAVLSTGSYQFVVITYDGSSVLNNPIIYMNGSSVSITQTGIPVGTIVTDATINMVLGNATTSSRWYSGAMDIVGIWTRALSASEVTTLYNGGTGMQYPFSSNNGNFFSFM